MSTGEPAGPGTGVELVVVLRRGEPEHLDDQACLPVDVDRGVLEDLVDRDIEDARHVVGALVQHRAEQVLEEVLGEVGIVGVPQSGELPNLAQKFMKNVTVAGGIASALVALPMFWLLDTRNGVAVVE